jgi:hypothetical protein
MRTAAAWRRAHPIGVIVAGWVLTAAAGVPAQLACRAPGGHGDDIRLAAAIVAAHERAGDAVLYQPPWWRQIAAAYPYGFCRLRDVSLARTPVQAGNFTGVQLPVAVVRQRLLRVHRVWLVEFLTFRPDPAIGPGWAIAGRWHPSTLVLTLYERRPAR